MVGSIDWKSLWDQRLKLAERKGVVVKKHKRVVYYYKKSFPYVKSKDKSILFYCTPLSTYLG